jgi:hypothetical protein
VQLLDVFLLDLIVSHFDELSNFFNRLLWVHQIDVNIVRFLVFNHLVQLWRVKCEWCGIWGVNRYPRLSFGSLLRVVFVIVWVVLRKLFNGFDLRIWGRCWRLWLACGLRYLGFQNLGFKQFFSCDLSLLFFLFPISLASNLLPLFDICKILLDVAFSHFLLKFSSIFHYHLDFHCFFTSLIGLSLVLMYLTLLLSLLNLLEQRVLFRFFLGLHLLLNRISNDFHRTVIQNSTVKTGLCVVKRLNAGHALVFPKKFANSSSVRLNWVWLLRIVIESSVLSCSAMSNFRFFFEYPAFTFYLLYLLFQLLFFLLKCPFFLQRGISSCFGC